VLAAAAPGELPPGAGPPDVAEDERLVAGERLAGRGVGRPGPAGGGFQPVRSLLVNLALLSTPTVSLQLDVAGTGGGRRAWFGVHGELGAALLTAAEGGVELSLFPAVRLGAELVRAVPEAALVGGPSGGIGTALTGPTPPPSGRLPLVAIEDIDALRRLADPGQLAAAVARHGLDAAELELAGQLSRRTTGTLSCRVLGRLDGDVAVGQVLWVATDAGWISLTPDPDGTGRRMVSVRPVARTDIGTAVAPFVAPLLAAGR